VHYYKIVDYEDGKIKTLFHGLNGSRTLPTNIWLTADQKLVRDGSTGTLYMSGWHVLSTYEECEQYLKKFINIKHKRIIECEVGGELRQKEHSRDNVFLADRIRIVK